MAERGPVLALAMTAAVVANTPALLPAEAFSAEPTPVPAETFQRCAHRAFVSTAHLVSLNARANRVKAVADFEMDSEIKPFKPGDEYSYDPGAANCTGNTTVKSSLQATSGDFSMKLPQASTELTARGGESDSDATAGSFSFTRMCKIAREQKRRVVRMQLVSKTTYKDTGHSAFKDVATYDLGALKCNKASGSDSHIG